MIASYSYSARDPLGAIRTGLINAESADAASHQLRRDGFEVIKIDEEGAASSFLSGRISKKDIIYTTSQLAIMVETGITIACALDTIVQQESNAKLQSLLSGLHQAVEAGEDFSSALARHPKYFDETYVSLIRASEATGSLGEMLDRIAMYMSNEQDTRSKIRSAMTYPAAMLTLSIAVTVFLLVFIMPKFEPLFNRPGAKLPASTKFLMTVSDSMLSYWFIWLASVVALIVGFIVLRRTDKGRSIIDYAKIHAPIIGMLFRKIALTRSIRTLGTMLTSGVSVLDALQLSSEVSGNVHYRRMWVEVKKEVTTGRRICDALRRHDLAPPMLVSMISSGENSGRLDSVLGRVSSYYDREVENTIKTTTGLIEPIMITCMGIIVGGIAMSLLLPIFSLSRPT